VPALCALPGSAYDDKFVTALSSELSFQPDTVKKLRHHRVPELTLRSLSRRELQDIFNITLNDAVVISTWSNEKLKQETEAERVRLEQETEQETEAERVRLKQETEAERARLKKQKLEQSKHVRIFNEVAQEYVDIEFSDQNSLQTFLSGSRIPALALVDANRSSTLLIATWERLVNNSCYAHPDNKREAVDVLISELGNEEKRKAEFGCGRLLSSRFQTEFHYNGSDIKMTSKSGRDLGDIDTLYISKNHSHVALLERKRSGSGNVSSVAELTGQVHATKKAFMDPATVFSVPAVWREFDKNASVISVVYCRAGPDSLFRHLTAEGIHVTTDALELLAPNHYDDL
jgi:hypothetical protein